jgi:hypothetical protein
LRFATFLQVSDFLCSHLWWFIILMNCFFGVLRVFGLGSGVAQVGVFSRAGRLWWRWLAWLEFGVCILYVNIIISCESVKWKCRKSFFRVFLIYDL